MSEHRFTVLGTARVEALLGTIVAEVGEAVNAVVPQSKIRALVLFGGYGRGEGGVEVTDKRT